MPHDDSPVLLFFRDFEMDRFIRYDRYVKRLVKPALARFGKPARMSGFRMWFQLLVSALEHAGQEVVVNDRRLARSRPDLPVGLVGYPDLLDDWKLPNPAILGPALFNHPSACPDLMNDPRFHYYLVTCDWMFDLFHPVFQDRTRKWYAGIDVNEYPNPPKTDRDIDLLVYDKIRWNRSEIVPGLMADIQRITVEHDLRTEVVKYGAYDRDAYLKLLARSRSMLFLCEHETQGMAYQEAMATDVPVLAWDSGYWMDPDAALVSTKPIPASSVPFFAPECGRRFRSPSDLGDSFGDFWSALDSFTPRQYVARELSLDGSASAYLDLVRSLSSG